MALDSFTNGSLLSQPMTSNNFTPQLSAKITTSGTSQAITFTPLTGTVTQTFFITNSGSNGAYIGWGSGSATAVASSGTPTASCQYILPGTALVLNFQVSTGKVDTIAAIQSTGSTVIEISLGFGS